MFRKIILLTVIILFSINSNSQNYKPEIYSNLPKEINKRSFNKTKVENFSNNTQQETITSIKSVEYNYYFETKEISEYRSQNYFFKNGLLQHIIKDELISKNTSSFIYNSKKQLIEINNVKNYKDESTSPNYKYLFQYNSKGYLIESIYKSEIKTFRKIKNEYQNNSFKTTIYSGDDKLHVTLTTTIKKNQIIKIEKQYANLNRIDFEEYKYDLIDNSISVFSTTNIDSELDSNYSTTIRNSKNKKGLESKYTLTDNRKKSVLNYYYLYDTLGNWIAKYKVDNSNPKFFTIEDIIIRQIKYDTQTTGFDNIDAIYLLKELNKKINFAINSQQVEHYFNTYNNYLNTGLNEDIDTLLKI